MVFLRVYVLAANLRERWCDHESFLQQILSQVYLSWIFGRHGEFLLKIFDRQIRIIRSVSGVGIYYGYDRCLFHVQKICFQADTQFMDGLLVVFRDGESCGHLHLFCGEPCFGQSFVSSDRIQLASL